MSEQPSPDHIMQTGFAFWPAKTLLSAVELGVFTALAKGPQRLAALEAALGLHKRASRDFLDALVALGFLTREDGVYSNTPSTDLFLDQAKPSYIGGILEMTNARLYPFWANLTAGLKTGEAQNEAKDGGKAFFDLLYADPARLAQFAKSMTGVSRGAHLAIVEKFPWSKYKTVVDVGAAQGDMCAQIALKHPHIQAIGFDLPKIQPVFDAYINGLGVADRVRFQAGSFFTDPLPKAEVVVMGHILHDWGLEDKRMLCAKAYEALPEGGAFIVYEALIDDERRHNAFGLMMSLNMLIETPDGFDFTGADGQGWMKEAGFRETRVEHLVGPDSMVVGIK